MYRLLLVFAFFDYERILICGLLNFERYETASKNKCSADSRSAKQKYLYKFVYLIYITLS